MNKLPIVISKYPNEVNMISFKKIANWKGSIYKGFAYDNISNKLIEKALNYKKITDVNINIDWEDDEEFDNLYDMTSIEMDKKVELILFHHALRIAAIVRHINSGGPVHPVELDTYSVNNCMSCIVNGHHRIRALQYLGYTHFPACCSGNVSLIKYLLNKEVDKKAIILQA